MANNSSLLQALWPTFVVQLAGRLATSAARKEPNKQLAVAKFYKTQRLVAYLVIFVTILYSIYETYRPGPAMDRGAGIYDILGVKPYTSKKQVAQAYRRLSLQYHPDKNPNAEETFDLINTSYQIYKDPKIKYVYDSFGLEGYQEYQKAGASGYGTVCKRLLVNIGTHWSISLFFTLIGALAGSSGLYYKISAMVCGAALELYFASRQWDEWYLPFPLFQSMRVVHNAMPICLTCLSLIFPKQPPKFDVAAAEMFNSVSKAKVLADRHLETITAPFQSDELTMERLQSVANGALS